MELDQGFFWIAASPRTEDKAGKQEATEAADMGLPKTRAQPSSVQQRGREFRRRHGFSVADTLHAVFLISSGLNLTLTSSTQKLNVTHYQYTSVISTAPYSSPQTSNVTPAPFITSPHTSFPTFPLSPSLVPATPLTHLEKHVAVATLHSSTLGGL
ncbi:unnamed protein product [Sphagnum jensenii]